MTPLEAFLGGVFVNIFVPAPSKFRGFHLSFSFSLARAGAGTSFATIVGPSGMTRQLHVIAHFTARTFYTMAMKLKTNSMNMNWTRMRMRMMQMIRSLMINR